MWRTVLFIGLKTAIRPKSCVCRLNRSENLCIVCDALITKRKGSVNLNKPTQLIKRYLRVSGSFCWRPSIKAEQQKQLYMLI